MEIEVIEKLERRGRPAELPIIILEKFERVFHEFANEQYQKDGRKTTFYYDINKSSNGPYKTEIFYPKGYKHNKFKAEKGKPYSGQPVVMAFKTSERSNAKTKIKVWYNQNVDYILSSPLLPGVPETAILLEIGVGESFINSFKSKYNA